MTLPHRTCTHLTWQMAGRRMLFSRLETPYMICALEAPDSVGIRKPKSIIQRLFCCPLVAVASVVFIRKRYRHTTPGFFPSMLPGVLILCGTQGNYRYAGRGNKNDSYVVWNHGAMPTCHDAPTPLATAEGTTKISCTHGGTDRNLRDSLSMQKSAISAWATRVPSFLHNDSYMVITLFPLDSFAPNRTSSLSPATTPWLFTRRSDMLVTWTQRHGEGRVNILAVETGRSKTWFNKDKWYGLPIPGRPGAGDAISYFVFQCPVNSGSLCEAWAYF